MKISASLFAAALLTLGVASIGHADAATTAADQSMAAMDQAQAQSKPVYGSEFQAAMNMPSSAGATSSRSSDSPALNKLDDVQVRGANAHFDPNHTFEGWWKDN